MTWSAIERYGTATAPGSLALVHDFMSTAEAGRPRQQDLLTDVDAASEWLSSSLDAWRSEAGGSITDPPALTDDDLSELRTLRAQILEAMIAAQERVAPSEALMPTQAVALEYDRNGQMHLAAVSSGVAGYTGLLFAEIYRAQLLGEWKRLKACRNDRCRGVFYDRSRNNSGAWHDVHTCGNVANLRAARARKKSMEHAAQA